MLTFPFPLTNKILQRVRPLQAEGRVSIPLALAADWTEIASYSITEIERGFITSFGYQVEDPTYNYSGSILFRVIINDSPVRDFASLQLQKGSAAFPFPTLMYMQPRDKITLQARRAVASLADQYVSGVLTGVAWPQVYCLPFDDSLAANRK